MGQDVNGAGISGTPVMAMADGVICEPNEHSSYGKHVVIKHVIGGTTYYTVYGHLVDSPLVANDVGKTIKKGQQIGKVGNTGNVSGAGGGYHLHFEIRIGATNYRSNATNPMNYFN